MYFIFIQCTGYQVLLLQILFFLSYSNDSLKDQKECFCNKAIKEAALFRTKSGIRFRSLGSFEFIHNFTSSIVVTPLNTNNVHIPQFLPNNMSVFALKIQCPISFASRRIFNFLCSCHSYLSPIIRILLGSKLCERWTNSNAQGCGLPITTGSRSAAVLTAFTIDPVPKLFKAVVSVFSTKELRFIP